MRLPTGCGAGAQKSLVQPGAIQVLRLGTLLLQGALDNCLLLKTMRGYRTKPQSSTATSPSVPVGRRGWTSPSFHRMRRGYVDMIQANPRCRRRELSTAGVFAAERLLEFAPPEV